MERQSLKTGGKNAFNECCCQNVTFTSRTCVVNYGEGTTIRNKIGSDANFKGVYCRSLIYTLYQIKMLPIDELNFSICKESLYTIPVVIYTKKNFYLLKQFNDVLGLLIQAGLIDFWRVRNFDVNGLNRKEHSRPKVIIIGQIEGCLKILITGYFIAGVVFVTEHVYIKKQNFYIALI